MKKILTLTLSLILTFGTVQLAWAYDLVTNFDIGGEITAGYLKLNDYSKTIRNYDYADGAFWVQLKDLDLKLKNSVKICDELMAQLDSQFQIYKDDDADRPIDYYASAINNVHLTYNPGFMKVMFDANGQEVTIGIPSNLYSDPLLRLNVARRFAKDGEKEVDANLLHPESSAKQLTVEVPYPLGRVVSVFSLEAESDGDPVSLVGGFAEVNLGKGKYALGYQAKMDDSIYLITNSEASVYSDNRVKSAYEVLAVDYHFAKDIRLQFDYSNRDENGQGYTGYWRPIEVLTTYPGTPFKIIGLANSILTYKNFILRARGIKTLTWGKWDKCWLDGAYYFKPFTLGINYRNWVFSTETAALDDGFVAELYLKHDLFQSWRDYLKVFLRTDRSFGACISVKI